MNYARIPAIMMLAFTAVGVGGATIISVNNLPEREGHGVTPVSLHVDFSKNRTISGATHPLELVPINNPSGLAIPVQFEADSTNALGGVLRWLAPCGPSAAREWVLEQGRTVFEPVMRVSKDAANGQWDIAEAERPVLRYNYQTNFPGALLDQVRPDDRKYARARSDYIHPLYGFDGEELTRDWSVDHPHHRGIYWAWPEIDYRGERGDLHALQRVFARPTGRCTSQSGPVFAEIAAENLWLWEDREPIVNERMIIRVWRSSAEGRLIDLEFSFTALKEDVAIARRETKLYGGLNLRFALVQEQQIVNFCDPVGTFPRRTWGELSGLFAGGKTTTGLAIFQNPANPGYPGDWIQYPEINWLQPTFPSAGTRYALKEDLPLVLRYRLWLHTGRTDPAQFATLWSEYARPVRATLR